MFLLEVDNKRIVFLDPVQTIKSIIFKQVEDFIFCLYLYQKENKKWIILKSLYSLP